jgi:hypothetical protein
MGGGSEEEFFGDEGGGGGYGDEGVGPDDGGGGEFDAVAGWKGLVRKGDGEEGKDGRESAVDGCSTVRGDDPADEADDEDANRDDAEVVLSNGGREDRQKEKKEGS